MKTRWLPPVIAIVSVLTMNFVATSSHAFPSGSKSPEEKADQMTRDATAAYDLGVEHQRRADTLLAHSDSTKASKEFKVALKEYEKAVKLNPNFPEALSNLGYCRRNLGDYAKALEAYDKALKLKPDFAEAMEYRGVAYVKLGRMNDAIADYIRLKTVDSTEAAELWEVIQKAQKTMGGQAAEPQR